MAKSGRPACDSVRTSATRLGRTACHDMSLVPVHRLGRRGRDLAARLCVVAEPRVRGIRVGCERCQRRLQLLPLLSGEAARDADEHEALRGVVQAEQKRRDAMPILAAPEPAHDTVGGAAMLHLRSSRARPPRSRGRAASRSPRRAPRPRSARTSRARPRPRRRGRDDERRVAPDQRPLELDAAPGQGQRAKIALAEREQVERDEAGGRLGGQLRHPRRRRVQS